MCSRELDTGTQENKRQILVENKDLRDTSQPARSNGNPHSEGKCEPAF